MGTEVYCKSHVSGYHYSMRDLNEDCSSNSWPTSYGDKTTKNGQFHYGLRQKIATDGYIGYGKDALKQKMLEHEAVFKSQVYELHRLYRIQKDLMEEFKRKGVSTEPSSSSPPMICTKGYNTSQPGHSPFQNVSSLKESERPLKLRKKLFHLQLGRDESIDKVSESDMSGQAPNMKGGHEITKLSLSGGGKSFRCGIKMVDLNEPFEVEQSVGLDYGSCKNNLSCSNPGPQKVNTPILSHPATGMPNQAPGSGSGPGPGPFFSSCFSGSQPDSRDANTSVQMIGKKWLINSSSNLNPVSGCVITAKNDYYHGSSSKSNPYPGFDNLNCCNRVFGQLLKNPSCLENSKPVIDIDLNEDGKNKQTLPWLTDLNQPSGGCEVSTMGKIETSETSNGVTKLLGFPIFQTQNVCMESKNRAIDINLECGPEEDRNFIDLNSCNSNFIEEYDILAPIHDNPDNMRLLHDKNMASDDELLRNAADIMVAISSSSSSPLAESLMWLACQLEAHRADTRAGPGRQHGGEMDDFEAMTLQIEETKEEISRLPRNLEEAGPAWGPPGLGQGRRGRRRQRRDFRREILPGLASLTRQEVTEDIQIFGGLMRAAGQHWALGPGRRRRGAHAGEEQIDGDEEDGKSTRRHRWGETFLR